MEPRNTPSPEQAESLPRLFTLDEVSEAARQSYATTLRHVANGRLKTVRPGGGHRRLVTEAVLHAYLHGETADTAEGREQA